EDAYFQLEVESLAGSKGWSGGALGPGLALRPVQIGAADDDRAGPAVVGRGQIEPVGGQGILRPAEHDADVGRVFARRVEVRVVADLGRQQHDGFRLVQEGTASQGSI